MKIFIGFDSLQKEASLVCEYSLRKHSRTNLDIVHLNRDELIRDNLYFRPDGDPSSTEFTYTRFLAPHLSNYTGLSMFVDSDFLFTNDVNRLFNLVLSDPKLNQRAAYCVKHLPYEPKNDTKFYGKPQINFPKKNWSSLIIFNNEHPSTQKLTPMTVSNKSPQWLHRFSWLDEDNNELGDLPIMWNWLVGEYPPLGDNPSALHYTNGGPFNGVYGQDYEEIWNHYYKEIM